MQLNETLLHFCWRRVISSVLFIFQIAANTLGNRRLISKKDLDLQTSQCDGFAVFWARLVTIQLAYFVVNKVVQWYNSGKTVPIFHKQTEAGDRLTAGVKLCTHARRKINNLWLHAFQVKDEQHSCSTLEVKDEQIGRCSRSTLEVKEEQIATRLRRNEATKWHQSDMNRNFPGWHARFQLHSKHSIHS